MIVSLKNIIDDFDVLFVDIYGVIKGHNGLIDGVDKTLENYMQKGKIIIILTNAPILSEVVEDHLKTLNLFKNTHYHHVVSSGETFNELIRTGITIPLCRKIYLYGKPSNRMFANTSHTIVATPEEADYIYLENIKISKKSKIAQNESYKNLLCEVNTEPGDDYIYEATDMAVFEEDVKYLSSLNKAILCANPDYFSIAERVDGKKDFVVVQGGLAKLFKQNGAKVIEIGKPHVQVYQKASEMLGRHGLGSKHAKICMIGDTLRTDIKGAINAKEQAGLNIKSILTLTGVSADEVKNYIDSDLLTEKLEQLFEKEGVKPDFVIKSLGN